MAWTQEKIQEVYIKAYNLAATDEAFREELVSNANAAIEKVAGEALPENFAVKIVENDPAYSATFVLPPLELLEGDLDMVAGGSDYLGMDCIGNILVGPISSTFPAVVCTKKL